MTHRHHLPKDRTPEPRAALRPRRHRATIAAMMAGLAGVMLLLIWLVPVRPSSQPAANADRAQTSSPSGWTVGMLRPDGLRIIVTGREDASAVLDPQRFAQAEVRHGYWIATRIPAVLNQLYCWCGCENRGVHRSNLQCFEDEMAKDCPVCLGTAEIAYDMTAKGITDAAKIQAAVDVHWGPADHIGEVGSMTTVTQQRGTVSIAAPAPRRPRLFRGAFEDAARGLAGLLLVASAAAFAQGETPRPDPASQASTPATTSSSAAAWSPLDSVRKWWGGSVAQPELLPPEQAFRLAVRADDANTLVAELTPARDYYLYRDRIGFSIADPPTVTVVGVSLPPGDPKADPTFGTVQVFHRPVEAVITLRHGQGQANLVQLRASYQGCNEPLGVCYPPIEKTIAVALPGSTTPGVTSTAQLSDASSSPAADASDEGRIRQLFTRGGAWALVATFFGFGVLLAFTPCMLPMIPILSGIIAGQVQHMTRRRALGLSAVYVLGMAITYALAGVAAGLAGTLLSTYMQSAWVLGTFAAIFVLLALSMFGLYELRLPAAIQGRLAVAGSRLKGGRAAGAFLMGVLSAVIVGPCVAAPLAGALLYIGQTRDVVLGGTALFAMALGMGAPLLAVGATTGTLLPKAGVWTASIQRVFGVGMLAVAVYMVSPVIPIVVQQLLWAALLIVPAVYMRALDTLPTDASGHRRLVKGVGVLALLAGAALMVGALSGHREILQPLGGFRGAERVQQGTLAFQPVGSLADLEGRLQAAHGRPVMLDFWAEWCVSCKEMDQFTFSDPRVQARLKDAVLLRADVTANTAEQRALLERFALFGPPGIVFFDKSGKEAPVRVIGYQSPVQFLASLDRVGVLP